jgi:hypothetical protein
VITGFNTDVEYQGVTYHVQTEDKGLETPLILSLVYSGGAILASKRSPYDDLIAAGFNEQTLAERLQRQHKLICAAINAGRLDDLKRMSGRAPVAATPQPARPAENVTEPAEAPGQAEPSAEQLAAAPSGEPVQTPLAPQPATAATPPPAEPTHTEPPSQPADQVPAPPPQAAPPPVKAEAVQAEAADAALHLGLLEERELRGGEFVTLRVRLSRGTNEARDAVPDATITLKILGTTFRPVISSARTDQDGIAIVFAALPRFNTGRAAILIRANAGGEEAEMRRIVQPS